MRHSPGKVKIPQHETENSYPTKYIGKERLDLFTPAYVIIAHGDNFTCLDSYYCHNNKEREWTVIRKHELPSRTYWEQNQSKGIPLMAANRLRHVRIFIEQKQVTVLRSHKATWEGIPQSATRRKILENTISLLCKRLHYKTGLTGFCRNFCFKAI